jgi:hypothetical protein
MLRASHRCGLTRVELAIVAGITAATIGLLLPPVQQSRAAANGRTCQYNLRVLAFGAHGYQTPTASSRPAWTASTSGHSPGPCPATRRGTEGRVRHQGGPVSVLLPLESEERAV